MRSREIKCLILQAWESPVGCQKILMDPVSRPVVVLLLLLDSDVILYSPIAMLGHVKTGQNFSFLHYRVRQKK